MRHPDLIAQLRSLRTTGRRLQATLVEDLRSFQKASDRSFFTLPRSKRRGISVATTCTALMALIDSNKLGALVPETAHSPTRLFSDVVATGWRSSQLEDLNAFSSCMVIRAAGFLVQQETFSSAAVLQLKHKKQSLNDVIIDIARDPRKRFCVRGYPPKATMAYWFVDGVTRINMDIASEDWAKIAGWSAAEFDRQLTYVVSGNDALMDPPSLAMAACLISRIRKTCAEKDLSDISENLPSTVELMYAISEVFKKQTDSGIWHKYFPLFHFPGSGAADYCFSFEFLEATLIEFSEFDILEDPSILKGIVKAVQWCDNNRIEFRESEKNYSGWNAGGEIRNLIAGMPEAWATACVHMFLAELESGISRAVEKLILKRFGVERTNAGRSDRRWNELIDVDLFLPNGRVDSLKKVTERELIKNKTEAVGRTLRNWRIPGRRSALLFGPPGTSKTTLAEVIADRLGWPLLVITPSHFLSRGLEQIYVRANEIFEDLMDISESVVLFDEMDALVQTRDNPAGQKERTLALDVTRQLLTTSMLPKLADLHKRARVIFLMATNHKQQLDPAIARPGRFDLLFCVGPPSWTQKVDGISRILKKLSASEVVRIQAKLNQLSDSSGTREQLNDFTVSDLNSFLDNVKGSDDLFAALNKQTKTKFKTLVGEWAENYITMNRDSGLKAEYDSDRRASRIQ